MLGGKFPPSILATYILELQFQKREVEKRLQIQFYRALKNLCALIPTLNVRYRNCTISKLYFSWKKQCKNEGTYFCSSTQFRQVLKLRVKFLKNPKKKQTSLIAQK